MYLNLVWFLYIAWNWVLIVHPAWQLTNRILSVTKYFPLTQNCHHVSYVTFFRAPEYVSRSFLILNRPSLVRRENDSISRVWALRLQKGCGVAEPLPPDFPALLSTPQLQCWGWGGWPWTDTVRWEGDSSFPKELLLLCTNKWIDKGCFTFTLDWSGPPHPP